MPLYHCPHCLGIYATYDDLKRHDEYSICYLLDSSNARHLRGRGYPWNHYHGASRASRVPMERAVASDTSTAMTDNDITASFRMCIRCKEPIVVVALTHDTARRYIELDAVEVPGWIVHQTVSGRIAIQTAVRREHRCSVTKKGKVST